MKLDWLDRAVFIMPIYYTLVLTAEQFTAAQKYLRIPKHKQGTFIRSGARCSFFDNAAKDKCCAVVQLADYRGCSIAAVSAMLAHEAVHIWQRCKEIIGEANPSHEFEAYCIQTIVLELISSYQDQTPVRAHRKVK